MLDWGIHMHGRVYDDVMHEAWIGEGNGLMLLRVAVLGSGKDT